MVNPRELLLSVSETSQITDDPASQQKSGCALWRLAAAYSPLPNGETTMSLRALLHQQAGAAAAPPLVALQATALRALLATAAAADIGTGAPNQTIPSTAAIVGGACGLAAVQPMCACEGFMEERLPRRRATPSPPPYRRIRAGGYITQATSPC